MEPKDEQLNISEPPKLSDPMLKRDTHSSFAPNPPFIELAKTESRESINEGSPKSDGPAWHTGLNGVDKAIIATVIVGILGFFGWIGIISMSGPTVSKVEKVEKSSTQTRLEQAAAANAKKKAQMKQIDDSSSSAPATCDETPNADSICIGGRIWKKKNMNVGTIINSSIGQTDNGVVEKYCYNDDAKNCDVYGGLYSWDEMMQYSVHEGGQGICPTGYHPPVQTEWEGLINSLGADTAGTQLKVDGTSGFNGLLSGYIYSAFNTWGGLESDGDYWSSTLDKDGSSADYQLSHDSTKVVYGTNDVPGGKYKHYYAVRCIKNWM